MSEFFIKRPNFAWVVALFISLAGLLVISKLPVVRESEINQKGKARKLWDIEEGKGI
ncbi:TPA: hypothetical protein ACGJVR_006887 [Pseudomonas aeruginosa]|nr:hypothetical protein [Pseudomonas aeruginosa]MCC0285124.1 hypothetical protein [Pseudomonas aeruginosa]MCC0393144.1 hypothetical protein [Pseudomonas aeruginosa]